LEDVAERLAGVVRQFKDVTSRLPDGVIETAAAFSLRNPVLSRTVANGAAKRACVTEFGRARR
jgi:hypothetical protein